MNVYHFGWIGTLDKIRLREGPQSCRETFRRIGQENRMKAARLLSEKNLCFPTLFILLPEVKALHLHKHLSERNRSAMMICSEILKNEVNAPPAGAMSAAGDKLIIETLEWMLQSGAKDDGLSHEYDEIMDVTASLLINRYKNNSFLKTIAEIIFRRNREGRLIHDLVWAFFQARDRGCLNILATYLRSANEKDVELARKLLNLSSPQGSGIRSDAKKELASFQSWLKENVPYVFFTGESFQRSSKPEPYRVNLAAKYLCSDISPSDGNLPSSITDDDQSSIASFETQDDKTKEILAGYSCQLYRKNKAGWEKWRKLPAYEQIRIAKDRMGGII